MTRIIFFLIFTTFTLAGSSSAQDYEWRRPLVADGKFWVIEQQDVLITQNLVVSRTSDGEYLAGLNVDSSWNEASGGGYYVHTRGVGDCAVSPDRQYVYFVSGQFRYWTPSLIYTEYHDHVAEFVGIVRWEWQTGRIDTLVRSNGAMSIAVTSTELLAASNSGITRYDRTTGAPLGFIQLASGIKQTYFSPNAEYVMLDLGPELLELWSVKEAKLVHRFPLPPTKYDARTISISATHLAFSDRWDSAIYVYAYPDVALGGVATRETQFHDAHALSGSSLYVSNSQNNGKLRRYPITALHSVADSAEIDPNARHIVTTEDRVIISAEGYVTEYNLDLDRTRYLRFGYERGSGFTALADGRMVTLSGFGDGRVFNKEGVLIAKWNLPYPDGYSARISGDQRYALANYKDQVLIRYDLLTGRFVDTIATQGTSAYGDGIFDISGDGKWLVEHYPDSLYITDIFSKETRAYDNIAPPLAHSFFDTLNALLVYVNNTEIQFVDLHTATIVRTFPITGFEEARYFDVDADPERGLFAIASIRQIGLFSLADSVISTHYISTAWGEDATVAISPRERRAYVENSDSIWVFDFDLHKLVSRLRSPTHLYNLTFATDGSLLTWGESVIKWKPIPSSVERVERSSSSAYAFPNPSTGRVTIHLPTESIGESITVCDITGRVIARSPLTGTSVEIDLSWAPVGTYFIKRVDESPLAIQVLR